MLQHQKNQPDNNQGNPERSLHNKREGNRYEGFEGMNYEQERQPYNSQGNTFERNGDITGGTNSERNDRF